MHFIGDTLPTGQRLGCMKVRNIRIHTGRGVVNGCALSDNQTDPTLSAAAIISGDIFGRVTARRMAARHRRHHNTIGNFQAVQRER